MKLRIDFYSKEEFGIEIIFLKDDPLPKNESSELILFTGYTLRQLNNLGDHPVAKALDGYLVSKRHFEPLLGGKLVYPLARQLLIDLNDKVYSIIYSNEHQQQRVNLRDIERQLALDDNMIDLLDNKILTPMPKLVKTRGDARKWFEMSLPSAQLEMKGFGLLFGDMNFYIYHSVLALAQFIAKRHKQDKLFLSYLSESASMCGVSHILRQITILNHMQLAVDIVNKVGALEYYKS